MPHLDRSRRPGAIYAFLVVGLATLMSLIALCREPGIWYIVATNITTKSSEPMPSHESVDLYQDQTEKTLHRTDFVVDCLRDVGLISDSTDLEKEAVVDELKSRLQWMPVESSGRPEVGRLIMTTRNPESASLLLNRMIERLTESTPFPHETKPAYVESQRGGSIAPGQLMSLAFWAALVGTLGAYFAERSKPGPILYCEQDVLEVAGVSVYDLRAASEGDSHLAEAKPRKVAWQRRLTRSLVTVSELAVVGVFGLMALHVLTEQSFTHRLIQNPFAAYGEALARSFGI